MAQSFTNADSALKEFYLPVIREQLNNKFLILSQIESNGLDVEGRRAVLSLHVSRNSGVGARASGGTLPTAGNQGYAEERVTMARNYGRMQVEGDLIAAMDTDRGSFTRAIESEMKGLSDDLKRDVNRQIYNDSVKAIARCTTTTADTEILLNTSTPQSAMRFFEIGMVIDVGTTAAFNDILDGVAITAVTRTAGSQSITTATSVTTDTNDYVWRAGSNANELNGLQEIVNNSGTLFNVNPATYEVWKSTVNSNSGTNRSFTDTLLETVVDDIDLDSGTEGPFLCVTTHGARRNFAAQLKTNKRFTDADSVNLRGGFKALTVDCGGTQVAVGPAERDCPDNTAFVLNPAHLKEHRMSDWDWMQRDGAVLNRVANVDAYEATLYRYHLLATDQRNAHGRIDDLTHS